MSTTTIRTKLWRDHWPIDLVIATAILSSLVFIELVAVPALAPARMVRHAGHEPLLVAHVFTGATMLVSGAIGLRIGLTKQGMRWHPWVGFTYLVAGSIASVIALVRSFDAAHTPGLSTGSLSAAWLAFTAMAWRAVRNRRYDSHRAWMIRSYVLAWTFVFCRFWTRSMPSALQGGETDLIWFTWIAPILICELALQWRAGAALQKGQ